MSNANSVGFKENFENLPLSKSVGGDLKALLKLLGNYNREKRDFSL